MPSPLDMPKRNPSPAALKQLRDLMGDCDSDETGVHTCVNEASSKYPEGFEETKADYKMTNLEKSPYVRKPHLTERPLKNHPGLLNLKAQLTGNEIAQEV